MSVAIIHIYLGSALLIKFFISSIYGIFFASVILYIFSELLFKISPLDAGQLIIWVSELDSEYKVAILTSLITITGFLIAFHTASTSAQKQLLSQLKIQASNEVEGFFSDASRISTDIHIFIELVLKYTAEILSGCNQDDAEFKVQYIQSQIDQFLLNRQKLVALSIEGHRLSGRHAYLLSTSPGLGKNLERAVSALSDVADKSWVTAPIININRPDYIDSFIEQINTEKYHEYNEAYNFNHNNFNGFSGAVRGGLLSPVVGFNFWSFISLATSKGAVREMIKSYRNPNS